jgi:hypothetical protein
MKAGDIFIRQRGFKWPPKTISLIRAVTCSGGSLRGDDIPEAYGRDMQIEEIVATKAMGDLAIHREWIIDPDGNELVSNLSGLPLSVRGSSCSRHRQQLGIH